MSFSDYRQYTAFDLRKIFQVEIKNDDDLFQDFILSNRHGCGLPACQGYGQNPANKSLHLTPKAARG